MKIIVSKRAERDLDEIWIYTQGRWGEKQAESYTNKIRATFHLLAAKSHLGKTYDKHETYLKYNLERHTIFYRVDKNNLYIVRILHQQMLPERHLN